MVCPKAMRGEAPPHKNNLIGSAAGGVLKSVCLKLVTSSKIALFHPRASTCLLTDDPEAGRGSLASPSAGETIQKHPTRRRSNTNEKQTASAL